MRVLVVLALAAIAASLLYEPLVAPCSSPLTYRVATIDKGFGITRNELLAALERAEKVWEAPSRRDLFRYAPDDGELLVHLVYDERQQVAQDHSRRRETIARESDTARDLRERHEEASRRYETARAVFLADKAAHEARVAAHNRRVAQWNGSGTGVPGGLPELQRDERRLDDEADALEKRRLEVNALADHANKLSERHNATVADLNENVEVINETAGEEFQQGRYVRDSRGVRIDVFRYESPNDLVHVLAHEMGHAIALEHNDDPGSIMYGMNSSESVVATPRDLEGLRERCGP